MIGSYCLKIPVICFLAAAASSACGQDRTWTSDNGNFKIEAALVEQLDGNVKLKRSDNGRVVKVPLVRFSKADQDYLKTLSSGGSSTKPGSATKSDGSKRKGSKRKGSGTKGSGTKGSSSKLAALNVSGQAQWSQDHSFGADGKEEPRALELVIEAKGEAAANALSYGMVKLEKCKTDKGGLKLKKAEFVFRDFIKEFVEVRRSDNEFFNEHPKDGVRVKLKFDHPSSTPAKFSTVRGEFKIKTGGKRETVEIDDLRQKLDRNIRDRKLKALDVKAKLKLANGAVGVTLKGNLDAVISVRLLDAAGNVPEELVGTSSGGGGGLFSYDFQFEGDDSIPEKLMLEIDTVKDLEELTVPFDLQDLDIPAA